MKKYHGQDLNYLKLKLEEGILCSASSGCQWRDCQLVPKIKEKFKFLAAKPEHCNLPKSLQPELQVGHDEILMAQNLTYIFTEDIYECVCPF